MLKRQYPDYIDSMCQISHSSLTSTRQAFCSINEENMSRTCLQPNFYSPLSVNDTHDRSNAGFEPPDATLPLYVTLCLFPDVLLRAVKGVELKHAQLWGGGPWDPSQSSLSQKEPGGQTESSLAGKAGSSLSEPVGGVCTTPPVRSGLVSHFVAPLLTLLNLRVSFRLTLSLLWASLKHTHSQHCVLRRGKELRIKKSFG